MDENMFEGFEMELQDLYDSVKNPFIESFFIKGEPNYQLGVCLKRSPESLQDVIAEEYNMELGRGKERKRQLEVLKQRIIEEMPRQIETMSVDELKLLMTLTAAEDDAEDAANGFGLQRKGWVFYYIDSEEEGVIPAVPVEIMVKLKEIINGPEFIRRTVLRQVFRDYISTFLRLYGVFDKDWLFTVIENRNEVGESVEEVSEGVPEEDQAGMLEWIETGKLIEMLKEQLRREQEESDEFGLEDDYIFDPDLEEDGDYVNRFESVKDKTYYEPTVEDITFYQENYIDERLKEYRLLKRYLGKKLDSDRKLEQLLKELSIEAVEELGGAFAVSEIMERYECAFSSAEDLKEFEQLFRNWEDHVRKWNNRGFTNAEMKERGAAGSSAQLDWDLANMKFKENTPDPDAPCPCGSGKKYRQCCGRVRR